MEIDPTNPYGNEVSAGDDELPDDDSWYELFEGVWRRMTNSAPSA